MHINESRIGNFKVLNLEVDTFAPGAIKQYEVLNMLTGRQRSLTSTQQLQLGVVYTEGADGKFVEVPHALDFVSVDTFTDELKTTLNLIETHGAELTKEQVLEFTKQLLALQLASVSDYIKLHQLNVQLVEVIENSPQKEKPVTQKQSAKNPLALQKRQIELQEQMILIQKEMIEIQEASVSEQKQSIDNSDIYRSLSKVFGERKGNGFD